MIYRSAGRSSISKRKTLNLSWDFEYVIDSFPSLSMHEIGKLKKWQKSCQNQEPTELIKCHKELERNNLKLNHPLPMSETTFNYQWENTRLEGTLPEDWTPMIHDGTITSLGPLKFLERSKVLAGSRCNCWLTSRKKMCSNANTTGQNRKPTTTYDCSYQQNEDTLRYQDSWYNFHNLS